MDEVDVLAIDTGDLLCKCKGSCSTKDGRIRKGCPCKTAGKYCHDGCSCARKTTCKNKVGGAEGSNSNRAPRVNATRSRTASRTRPAAERASELVDCERENVEVKNMITVMEVGKLRILAIRVLARGLGSLEYIQSQLAADEDVIVNFYGSPIAPSHAPVSTTVTNSFDSTSGSTSAPVLSTSPVPLDTPSPTSSVTLPGSPVIQSGQSPQHSTPIPPYRRAPTHIPLQTSCTTTLPGSPALQSGQSPQHSTPIPSYRHADGIPDPQPPPVFSGSTPAWCRCGHCRQMPKAIENVCCKNKNCVTETFRFYKLCLDPDILQLSILDRGDVRSDRFDNSSNQFRKAAYRHFILDKHGHLGRTVRRVVPSCSVWKIRVKYPSPTGIYMGFRES